MKLKSLVLGLSLVLLILQSIQFSKAPFDPTPLVTGRDFSIEFETGHSFTFQGDDKLTIDVLSGVLNASSTYLLMNNRKGEFRFVALNDASINVSSPDAEQGFDIEILGARTTRTNYFVLLSVIKSGDTVRILWGWRIVSWVDNTMLALGFSGLILMVASPTWVAFTIRKKGLDPDSIERAMYGVLLFLIGFGLVVMWLW